MLPERFEYGNLEVPHLHTVATKTPSVTDVLLPLEASKTDPIRSHLQSCLKFVFVAICDVLDQVILVTLNQLTIIKCDCSED